MLAVVIGILLALGLWLFKIRVQHHPSSEIRSIAVLPLRDLSPNSDQEYFADGVTEELITSLAQSLPLRVISRTSVMRYKQTSEPITQIAKELGVEAIIEGAVARSENRVAVTIQLIDAKDDRHLWAHEYKRQIGDILSIETELAQQIASQVGVTLSPEHESKAAAGRAIDPQAYQLYLKGRYFWNKRTGDGFLKAAEYFQQAVDLDPNYAEAYVGLADCYAFGHFPRNRSAEEAEAMAQKALALDDRLGEAHATLGLLAENRDWNWVAAETEYKRAISLNPNYASAHQWYGEELAITGRFDEALRELKLAGELDPLSLIIMKDTGEIYYFLRKFDVAIGYFRKALEMDPNFVLGRANLGLAYLQKRDYSSAISEFRKAASDSPDALAGLGCAYGLQGRKLEAEQVLSDLKLMSQRQYVDLSHLASIYAALGDKEKALVLLEQCYREHALLTGLKVDPRWDNLRSDPRFVNLMKRIGLAP
jgi:TolB-like protein/Tfp pilus assembly protein PilF